MGAHTARPARRGIGRAAGGVLAVTAATSLVGAGIGVAQADEVTVTQTGTTPSGSTVVVRASSSAGSVGSTVDPSVPCDALADLPGLPAAVGNLPGMPTCATAAGPSTGAESASAASSSTPPSSSSTPTSSPAPASSDAAPSSTPPASTPPAAEPSAPAASPATPTAEQRRAEIDEPAAPGQVKTIPISG